MEPLVLSVSDFGWLYSHLHVMILLRVNSEFPGQDLVPSLHLGMVRLPLEWPPYVKWQFYPWKFIYSSAQFPHKICGNVWIIRTCELSGSILHYVLFNGGKLYTGQPCNLSGRLWINEGQIIRSFWTIVQIILELQISEGQIIWAILYIYNNSANYLGGTNCWGSNYSGYTVHL